jgi:hypothetical protein
MANKYEGAEVSSIGCVGEFVLGLKTLEFMVDFFTLMFGTEVINMLDEDD